jgi:preprotein translocase subunit SecB
VINAQYVKDLSFENPNAPHSLLPGQPQPQVGLAVDVNIQRLNENTFEVVLDLKAEARLGERVAFLAEVSYAGVFTLNGVQAEHQRPFLLIEGPRLLFPFARNIIADVTRDGGYPPLLVAPIDFGDLYRRQAAAQAEVGTA